MDYAQVIGSHQRRLAGDGSVQQVLGLALGIGIEAEDRAEVGFGHHGQHQAIDLGGRQGFFVREDLALAEPREPLAAQEAAADVGRAGVGELLVVDVDGRIGLGCQDALVAPLLVEACGPGVAVVARIVVARLDAVQVDPYEAVRMESGRSVPATRGR